MKNVFIDTNIWLSLYHFTNDDLSQFEKLKDMLNNSINLIVPQQVYDEILRNRETKILDALKSLEIQNPKYPVFCKGYDDYEELKTDIDSIVKKFKEFKKKVEADIISENLPADNTLSSFFSVIEKKPCASYINKAYDRYRIGNPPGKDNKYGDAINWECLLDVVPNGHDLYFISADKDYCSSVSPDKMHPFLIKEWMQLKNSNIYFYSTLVKFLKDHVQEIQLQGENEKEKLIKELYNSTSFEQTHAIISSLNQYSEWTDVQIEKLCWALEDNNQINWIFSDFDIFNFYKTILSNINHTNTTNTSIKYAIDLIKEKENNRHMQL